MAKRLRLPEVVDLLEKAYGKPRTAEHPEAPLLDHLLVGVLTAFSDRDKVVRALRALSESFLDLNEARVSPIAELTAVLHPFLGTKAEEAAHGLRAALQDVYDGTHGLDLEPLRGRDPEDLRKFLKELPHTDGGPASAVFQLALGTEHLALTVAEHRVLERLKVLPQSPNPQRVRQALEKQVKPGDRLGFAWAVGSHAHAVCRAKAPRCEDCALLAHCPVGEQEVKRREVERKKEEARRVAEEKKRRIEAEKAAKEAARKQAIEDKKRKLAEEKAARVAAAKAAAEKKAKAEAEKKAKAKAEAEAERKAKAEAEKKAKAAAAKAKKKK